MQMVVDWVFAVDFVVFRHFSVTSILQLFKAFGLKNCKVEVKSCPIIR